jgi:hypothetical protein
MTVKLRDAGELVWWQRSKFISVIKSWVIVVGFCQTCLGLSTVMKGEESFWPNCMHQNLVHMLLVSRTVISWARKRRDVVLNIPCFVMWRSPFRNSAKIV